ncbi:MAG: hypothetical protein Q8P57_02275 [Candidatus Pacearchaeota archaeon]|nr:hypothetical protein [Candidatus Pacearchaeota archaeon]
MKEKKGSSGMMMGLIVSGVIAIIILLIIFKGPLFDFLWGTLIKGIAIIIPNFDLSKPGDGVTIVGYDLSNPNLNLQFYDGEKWKGIDVDETTFRMGENIFNPKFVATQLKDFYISERRPPSFILNVNHWRVWVVDFQGNGKLWSEGRIPIISKTKNGFEGVGSGISLGMSAESRFNYFDAFTFNSLNGGPLVEKSYGFIFESEKTPGLENTLISWRDQILEGRSCEKFLKIRINKNGEMKEKQYKVKKLDNYVYIDFEEEVLDGEVSEWEKNKAKTLGDEKCFVVDSYVDEDRSDWVNDAGIVIEFKDNQNGDKWTKLWWDSKSGWRYQSEDTFKDGSIPGLIPMNVRNNNELLETYRISDVMQESFYPTIDWIFKGQDSNGDGLLFSREAFNIKVFVIVGGNSPNIELTNVTTFFKQDGSQWHDEVDDEDEQILVTKIIYNLLSDYNAHFKNPSEESP